MTKPFKGKIDVDIRNSTPDWEPYVAPKAPEGSPNVLMIVMDDTGIAAWDAFGGLVEMPTFKRLAESGLRFSQWHTTALCSPTRSCLLTGRNCHENGMAIIEEGTSGFPGKNGHIPFENALLSEILVDKGYNTYMCGKWHLCPAEEMNMAATKRNWPMGRGFERYYGFLGGETNQWYPDLVSGTEMIDPPYKPEQGYHLSKDLADRAIQFVKDGTQVAPDKPWFLYFCPGATHAPHHVWKDWADKYKGKFDMGYEKYREIALENMKKLGIVPQDTQLPPMNPVPEDRLNPTMDITKPWDSLSDDEKKLFSRMAEVYAGFSSYTDYEIGRLIDFLEQSGQLENTIVVVCSDNGASGEGGPMGSVNENLFFNGIPDDMNENLKHVDDLGSPNTYNHYPNGWAMAFNTPFKMWKRWSYNGGICDPLIISWPKGIKAKGDVRHQYHHAIDVVPTILDCLGFEAPEVVRGVTQTPIQGVSMRYAFEDPNAPGRRTTQYYEMLGTRGIWHEGWKAVAVHGPTSGLGHYMDDKWELYHTAEDRSESRNLADQHPDKLRDMVAIWWHEAGRNKVLPLDDRVPVEILGDPRPQVTKPRDTHIYYPNCAPVPELATPDIRGRSYKILADVDIQSPEAEGVILAHGSHFGGHTMFVKGGKLYYVSNFVGLEEQKFVSNKDVPTGKHVLGAEFIWEKQNPPYGSIGTLKLYIDGEVVAQGPMKTQPGPFTLAGEGLCVGRDSGDAVSTEYQAPFVFHGGTILGVGIHVGKQEYSTLENIAVAMLARE